MPNKRVGEEEEHELKNEGAVARYNSWPEPCEHVRLGFQYSQRRERT